MSGVANIQASGLHYNYYLTLNSYFIRNPTLDFGEIENLSIEAVIQLSHDPSMKKPN